MTGLSGAATGANSPTETRPGSRSGQGENYWRNLIVEPEFEKQLSALAETENSIISTYDSLPPELVWNVDKYVHVRKFISIYANQITSLIAHIQANNGDMFIHLHLWASSLSLPKSGCLVEQVLRM
jgi:hypothetical protein